MRVLTAALAERQRKTPVLHRWGFHLEKRVAGVAGDDLAIHPDWHGRVKIATFHPARRIFTVNRRHWAKNDIRTGFACLLQKCGKPVRRGGLIIVDKGQIVRPAFREAGVAGNRDIRFRAMDIGDLERRSFTQPIHTCLGTRFLIIVGNDQANCHAFGHFQFEE